MAGLLKLINESFHVNYNVRVNGGPFQINYKLI